MFQWVLFSRLSAKYFDFRFIFILVVKNVARMIIILIAMTDPVNRKIVPGNMVRVFSYMKY